MPNVTMKARDTIAAKLAECFITIGSRRYNFMQMIDMEAKVEKTKTTVPRLGAIMAGHKSCGMEGTFSGTAHYNQSVLRQALLDYKNTGEDVYFEMQITNDDPTSDAGRQTIIFYDCNTDGGVLAKFDADGEYLDEEIEGTFEDFSMPESFAINVDMSGMQNTVNSGDDIDGFMTKLTDSVNEAVDNMTEGVHE
jgi:hypothetical protein